MKSINKFFALQLGYYYLSNYYYYSYCIAKKLNKEIFIEDRIFKFKMLCSY